MPINIYKKIKLGKETFLPIPAADGTFKMDWWMEAGGSVPNHVHRYMDEHFTIISGTATFNVAGKTEVKQAGESLFIPKGTIHGIKNKSTTTLNIQVVYTPPSDTVQMFQIIHFLNQKYPDQASNMVKYFYMFPRLGLLPFSEIPSPMVMKILSGVLTIVGFFAGWNKLVSEYKHLAK
jgi:mannose-6-phosphate isomerase-like protein (cupin superfamily)